MSSTDAREPTAPRGSRAPTNLVDFPLERPRARRESGPRASRAATLPPQLVDAIVALARRLRATSFEVVVAAFSVLLQRYSGQEELTLGISSGSGGERRALRLTCSEEPKFGDVVEAVRDGLERAVATAEPFDVLCIDGATEAASESAATLALVVDDGRHLRLSFSEDVIGTGRAALVLAQLRALLDQLAPDPDERITVPSLLTPESRNVLPDPTAPLPEPDYELIPSVIARVARASPRSDAVRLGARTWTYGALEERSRELAVRLVCEGIQRGEVVAITGDSSFGLIASLVAVLRSGATLLTLDPRHPAQRHETMLRATGAKLVLDSGPERRSDFAGARVLSVDPASGETRSGSGARSVAPLPEIRPDDPAYVFFTSGTTGTPKGIVGCHKGLAHFLHWQRTEFGVDERDRCAQLTGLSFDVVLRSILLPLTSGGELCLPTAEDAAPGRVWRWMTEQRVTLVHAVPALANVWLLALREEDPRPPLRYVFFAGEPLTEVLAARWRELVGARCAIVNLYGPTETTLAKCFHRVIDIEPGIQPVGRPQPSSQALVLTKDLRLCGVGEPGEVFIRTPFRTLGYLNAPHEQVTRFLANPFTRDVRDLVYRTGDRGRYRLDGTLELRGRVDDQVKIDGVRVEPAEVSAVLASHPDIDSTVVVAVRPEGGHDFLAAYYVPRSGRSVDAAALQVFLATRLPSAFVPSAFVAVERLPLSANGKVDRRALPPVPLRRRETSSSDARTPIEETIARAWAEALHVAKVGRDDDVILLGAHSLAFLEVHARVRQLLGVDLSVNEVFANPTVAKLAARIGEQSARSDDAHAEPILGATFPLSAEQEIYLLECPECWQSGKFWRIRGALDVKALARALDAVILRHEALRTVLAAEGAAIVQRVIDGPPPHVTVVHDLRSVPEPERDGELRRRAAELCSPYDMQKGPLVRSLLARTGEAEHVFGLSAHHVVSDAFSMNIIENDLAKAYAAFVADQPSPPFTDVPFQPREHVASQRRRFERERTHEENIRYWESALAGRPPVFTLGEPRPVLGPLGGFYETGFRLFEIPESIGARLEAFTAETRRSPPHVLMAAFFALLHRLTAKTDIVIAAGTLGRDARMLGGVGCYTELVPVRLPVSASTSFTELLDRTRDSVMEAQAHAEISLARLWTKLGAGANESALYATLFNYFPLAPPFVLEGVDVVREVIVQPAVYAFDVHFAISELGRRALLGSVIFNATVVAGATVQRLIDGYVSFLDAALSIGGASAPVGAD